MLQSEAFVLWYQVIEGGRRMIGLPADLLHIGRALRWSRAGKTYWNDRLMRMVGEGFVTIWDGRGARIWYRSVGWLINGEMITLFGRVRGVTGDFEVASLRIELYRALADDTVPMGHIKPSIVRDDGLAIRNDLFMHARGLLQ